MSFLSDDFLLSTPVARELYHGVAAKQPVIDYHNHLSPKDIAENRRFDNLAQVWLEGDHYKWRAMRADGVPEDLITGRHTTDLEKFKAWSATVPHTLRNPLYVWTHLELRPPLRHQQAARRIHRRKRLAHRVNSSPTARSPSTASSQR